MTSEAQPRETSLREKFFGYIADDLEAYAEQATNSQPSKEALMPETTIDRLDGRTTTARDVVDLSPDELREMRGNYAGEISKRQRQLDDLVEGRLDDREIMRLRSEISANRGTAVGGVPELQRDLHYAIESMRNTVRLVDRRLAATEHRQRRADVGAARGRLSAEASEISRETDRLEDERRSLAFAVVALGDTALEADLAAVEADLDALRLRSDRFSAALAELDRREADHG